MMHGPIQLDQISLVYPHKTCFENFTSQIRFGDRIAIIGRNGSGKSSLLKMLLNKVQFDGNIILPEDIQFGYVPQIIDVESASGAERFQTNLTNALSKAPNCLLLDEPTNHLDQKNCQSLMRLLDRFEGTLIIVSHDQVLLRSMNYFLEIVNGKITTFNGKYDDYVLQKQSFRGQLQNALYKLKRERKIVHDKLMHEQLRAKKRKEYGEKKYNGDKLALRSAQGAGERTIAKNCKYINQEKSRLLAELNQIVIPKVIYPSFSILSNPSVGKTLLSIQNGSCVYHNQLFLNNINLTLNSKSRIAILGANKSGKTTLIKAILNFPIIQRLGQWFLPREENIGYIDQHYQNLANEKSIFNSLQEVVPNWTNREIRDHLATFLFFKNAEINMLVKQLSGGEKVRLSLALIAATTPPLLILDEVTNNLDLETKEHVIQVLREYPGAIIAISHDDDFLNSINLNDCYEIKGGTLIEKRTKKIDI